MFVLLFALMQLACTAVVIMLLCLNVETAQLDALGGRMVVCDISMRAVAPHTRIDLAHRLTCICVHRLRGLRCAAEEERER